MAQTDEVPDNPYTDELKRETKAFVDKINELGSQFETLCIDRHEEGQEKYGTFTFLGNDIMRMALEELADTVNYCRYQAIKLQLIQELIEQEMDDKGLIKDGQEEITIGIQAFKGTKDVGWGNKS